MTTVESERDHGKERRMAATDAAAFSTIRDEVYRRNAKTARLRALRLALAKKAILKHLV